MTRPIFSTVTKTLSSAFMLVLLFCASASAQTIKPGEKSNWYKADLHTHYTFHGPLEKEVARYKETGYKFLVLSTKDTTQVIKYSKYSSPDMLVIEGVEQSFMSRKDKLGHVLAFPIKAPYPITSAWTLKQGYEKLRLKNKSVILGVNHPHDGRWSLEDVVEAYREGAPLFELNSSNMKHGEFETSLWDEALTAGAKMFGTLTNDVHSFGDIDAYGYIMIRAESLDLEKILAAIRKGDFYAEESGCAATPERYELVSTERGKMLIVNAPGAAKIRIIAKGGKQLVEIGGESAEFPVKDGLGYVRAEIIDKNGFYIFMQPIFIE